MRKTLSLPFALACALAAGHPMPSQTQAPQGGAGVRLVYDLPVEALQRSQRTASPLSIEQLLAEAVETVQTRVGDDGRVARHGTTGFTVELPRASAQRVDEVRRRIANPGQLEMRVVATDDYVDARGRKLFDLAQEKQRLVAWLQSGGTKLVQRDPAAIGQFHDDADRGPIARPHLRWYVHLLTPTPKNPAAWSYSFAGSPGMLGQATVAVFDAADYGDGAVPAAMRRRPQEQQRLVELVAVNMDEVHFSGADLDPSAIGCRLDAGGAAAITYRLKPERRAAYGDWSEKYIRKHSAIILNGAIHSAPVFVSRIPGNGQITGSFTQAEAEDLAAVLKSRPLPVLPVLLRQETFDDPKPATGRGG